MLPPWRSPSSRRPTGPPVALAVGWTSDGEDGYGTLWLQEAGSEPGVVGVHVRRGEPAAVIAELADRLQDQFFAETRSAWGEARPACPGHGHPAVAEVEDAVAWWVCPSTGARVARIGAARP
jgi:hypothetical protein